MRVVVGSLVWICCSCVSLVLQGFKRSTNMRSELLDSNAWDRVSLAFPDA